MTERAALHNSAQTLVRISTISHVPEVLRSLGLDPLTVLTGAGIEPTLFDDPDSTMGYAARSRLLAHCAAISGRPHFGLQVGVHNHLHSFGLTGLLAKYSPSVEKSLRNLEHFLYLHVGGGGLRLRVDGALAILSYDVNQKGTLGTEQVGSGAVATMFNILQELCGPDWKPIELCFMHRTPEVIEPFRSFFRAHLRFDADYYAVVFSASWLKRPPPDTDPEVLRLIQKQVDSIAARSNDDSFLSRVRTVLRGALTSGNASETQVGTLFSMHPRTFTRRLNERGVGFQELVNQTRFELACQFLNASDLQINQIAEILHYADARSFIRAFRRWSGTTPARWRAAEVNRARRSPKREPPVDPVH